jgi:hypothetical protein
MHTPVFNCRLRQLQSAYYLAPFRLPAMTLPLRYKSVFVLLPLLTFVVYVVLLRTPQINYFRDLAAAFLDGRLHLEDLPDTHDLVFFKGKYYPYWPPVPALVWLPIDLLTRRTLADGLVSSAAGALNVGLLLQICRQLSERFKWALTTKELAAIGLFWAFGTVHFYLASSGNTWYFAQTIAQTFLLSSLYLFGRGNRWFWAGLCFAGAVYSRNNLIFAVPAFLALYAAGWGKEGGKSFFRRVLLFGIPLLGATALNFWYNHARFGDPFENGLQYHLMDPYFRQNFEQHGYFSTAYLPYNFWVEVLKPPPLTGKPPFIKPDPEGFGMLWASPLLMLVVPALWVWISNRPKNPVQQRNRLFATGNLLSAVAIGFTIFLIMGTGWRQFGARYTLDFQVFVLFFILCAWPTMRAWKGSYGIAGGLLLLSIIVEAIGVRL